MIGRLVMFMMAHATMFDSTMQLPLLAMVPLLMALTTGLLKTHGVDTGEKMAISELRYVFL